MEVDGESPSRPLTPRTQTHSAFTFRYSPLSLPLSLRLRCLLLGSVVLLKANRATLTQKVNIDENTNRTKDSFFFFVFSLFIIYISIIWGTMSHQTGSVLLLERDKQKKRRYFAAIKLSKLSVAAVVHSLWTWLWHCRGTAASSAIYWQNQPSLAAPNTCVHVFLSIFFSSENFPDCRDGQTSTATQRIFKIL